MDPTPPPSPPRWVPPATPPDPRLSLTGPPHPHLPGLCTLCTPHTPHTPPHCTFTHTQHLHALRATARAFRAATCWDGRTVYLLLSAAATAYAAPRLPYTATPYGLLQRNTHYLPTPYARCRAFSTAPSHAMTSAYATSAYHRALPSPRLRACVPPTATDRGRTAFRASHPCAMPSPDLRRSNTATTAMHTSCGTFTAVHY